MSHPILTEIFANADIDPIPVGIRTGNLVHASRITGVDLETGHMGGTLEEQLKLAFTMMRHVVETAGGSIDQIAQVSFFLKDFGQRAEINPPWVAMFPNDQDRPTYKFMAADLPGECLVQMEMWAVLDGRRRVINTPGVAHTNPIPMGTRVGDMVFSSRILPFEPSTNAPGEGLERQTALVFQNLGAFLEAAEITREELLQARLFVADRSHVPTVQRYWDTFFAGASERPIIRTVHYPQTPAAMVYIEVIGRG